MLKKLIEEKQWDGEDDEGEEEGRRKGKERVPTNGGDYYQEEGREDGLSDGDHRHRAIQFMGDESESSEDERFGFLSARKEQSGGQGT